MIATARSPLVWRRLLAPDSFWFQGAVAALTKIFSGVAGLATFALLSRRLEADAYGMLAASWGLAMAIGRVCTLGVPPTTMRILSATGDAAEASAVVRWSLQRVGAALALAVVALLGLWQVGSVGGGLAAATPLVVAYGLSELVAQQLRGLDRLWSSLIGREVLWRGLLLVFVGVAGEIGPAISVGRTLIVAGVLLGLAVAMQYAVMQRETRFVSGPAAPIDARKLRSASRSNWGVSILSTLPPNAGPALVAVVLGFAPSGYLFSSIRSVMLLSMPLITLNIVAAPRMARAHGVGDKGLLQRELRNVSMVVTPLAIALIASVVIWADELLVVFGDGAVPNSLPLRILVIGFGFDALAGPTSMLLQMVGDERYLLRVALFSVALGIGIVVVSGWVGGLPLAAAGFSLELVVRNTLSARRARHRLGVDSSPLCLISHLRDRAPQPDP